MKKFAAISGQRRIIYAYFSGRKDVFVSTPTGSGKSLTFQDFEVAPYVFDNLENGQKQHVSCVCLVVAPLVALIKDQVVNVACFKFWMSLREFSFVKYRGCADVWKAIISFFLSTLITYKVKHPLFRDRAKLKYFLSDFGML